MTTINAEYSVPFTWCGMEWVVHTEQTSYAAVDSVTGNLHLCILLDPTGTYWPWVDLISLHPVHYGTFQYTMVTDISAMILGTAPGFTGGMSSLAFAMYVCDENVKPFRGEISIEPCQWGDPHAAPMSWLEDTPTDPTSSVGREITPYVAGPNTVNTLTWNPLFVKWEANGGTTGYVEKTYYNDSVCVSPTDTGGMFVRLMLSNAIDGGSFPSGLTQVEVVLSNFTYTPLVPTWPDVTTIPTLTDPLVIQSGSDHAFVVTLLDSNNNGINLTAVSEIFWCVFKGGVILEKCYTNTPATDTITILNPEAGTIVVTLTADETSPSSLGSTTATNSYHHEGRLVFADGTQKVPSNLDGTLRITPTSTWGVSPPDSATPPVSKPVRGAQKQNHH